MVEGISAAGNSGFSNDPRFRGKQNIPDTNTSGTPPSKKAKQKPTNTLRPIDTVEISEEGLVAAAEVQKKVQTVRDDSLVIVNKNTSAYELTPPGQQLVIEEQERQRRQREEKSNKK